MKTCLHRLFGECKECKKDYNLQHHPNNYDCGSYQEINMLVFKIKDKTLEKRTN
jgi:hypothetical protein